MLYLLVTVIRKQDSGLIFDPTIRFLLLLVMVALVSYGTARETKSPGSPQAVVTVGTASFKVELAITQDQRTQGLSGRTTLAPRSGMLFVFDEEALYSFWMKEMRFPLDVVWIDARCTVVDILRMAPPPAPGQGLDELAIYNPDAPALYVLEVNGGETGAVGVRLGDRVEFAGSLAGLYLC